MGGARLLWHVRLLWITATGILPYSMGNMKLHAGTNIYFVYRYIITCTVTLYKK